MPGEPPPAVDSTSNECAEYGKQSEHSQNRNPNRWAGKLVLVRLRNGHARFAMSEVIFGEQIFFIEAQKTRDGADKSAVENAAREFIPLFVFEGFKEARTNARGRSHFLQRNFAHLALALQAFAKSSAGHDSNPILADTSGAAARSNSLAIASKPAAAGAHFLRPFYLDDRYSGSSGVTARRCTHARPPVRSAQGEKFPRRNYRRCRRAVSNHKARAARAGRPISKMAIRVSVWLVWRAGV